MYVKGGLAYIVNSSGVGCISASLAQRDTTKGGGGENASLCGSYLLASVRVDREGLVVSGVPKFSVNFVHRI